MMPEKKRKRGRPRVAPILSYGTELKMRSNSNTRAIKKPKYLKDQDDEDNRSGESTPARSIDNTSNHSKGSLNKNAGVYNTSVDDKDSEYHYGSDFEVDNDSDAERNTSNYAGLDSRTTSDDSSDAENSELDEIGDGLSEQDGVASDTVSSFVPFWKLGPAGTLGYRAHTPIPVWLQDRDYPDLELPTSSDDLLIPKPCILRAVGVYEVLRHFRNLARLSPFHFEDFCVTLLVEEQSALLSEIHIALLKAIIREEDSQQTHFGQLDQKDSTNIALYFIDPLTWPETLRQYLYSEPSFKTVLDILNSCNYPFTSLANRLKVLQFLCDQFLQTSVVRDFLIRDGKIRYDDTCRSCHKMGDLLCCDSCSAVYHLECANPPLTNASTEMEDWTCSICNLHKIEGVTDCMSLMEASGLMSRQEPLGYDRHGRKYWFLVRRLFVEAEDGDVCYYSTLDQFDLIIALIDGGDLEESLFFAFKEFGDDIRRQMEITEKLTNTACCGQITQITIESDEARIRIEEIKSTSKTTKKPKEEEDKDEKPDESKQGLNNSSEVKTETKEEVKEEKQEGLDERLLNNSLDDEKCKPKVRDVKPIIYDDEEIQKMTETKISQLLYLANGLPFRLGCTNNHRNYSNHFATNTLSLNKMQHNEERDKKRHLAHKFSLVNGLDFKWCGVANGSRESQVSTIRQTLLSLEQNISSHFFHPNWHHHRKLWNVAASTASTPNQFTKTLVLLIAGIKPIVFMPVWHDGLGYVRLKRLTALEREERKKHEKREKKESEEEAKLYPFVKYTKPIKHQLWKMRGEEYRMHGLWGWQWLSSFRRSTHLPMSTVGLRAGPDTVTLPVKGSGAAVRGLPVNGEMFKKFLAQNPNLKVNILSPKQIEEAKLQTTEEEDTKVNNQKEIYITNAGKQQKLEIAPVNLEEHFEDGLINISKALNSRTRLVYPKISKGSSLDSLLTRRLSLKIQEERRIASKMEKKSEENDEAVDLVNDSDDTEMDDSEGDNIEELPDSQRTSGYAQGPTGNLLKEMRNHKLKYEALDKVDELLPCYSPTCRDQGRSNCYSPSCILKERTKQKLINSVNSYKIVSSKPAPFDTVGSHSPIRLRGSEKSLKRRKPNIKTTTNAVNGEITGEEKPEGKVQCNEDTKDERIFSSECTSGKIYLKQSHTETKRIKKITTNLPPVVSFRVSTEGKLSKKCEIGAMKAQYTIFGLPYDELRIMARKAARYNPSGFNSNAKSNNFIWPYPSSRPNFKVTWLYRTVTLPNISAAAYQLRILWACLRWEDMNEKGPLDGRKQVTSDLEIIQTELLKRKSSGRYLEKTEYLRRKVIIPLDAPKAVREFTPSQRSGLRKRKRALSPVNRQPESLEEWVDEEKLDLWEIRFFGERLDRAVHQSKKLDKENLSFLQTSSSPSDFKAKIEEQLRMQRATFNQKKSLEGQSPGIIKVAIGSALTPGGAQKGVPEKMIIGGSSVISVGSNGKLPSVVPGRKIVTSKGGRIITVQTASGTATASLNTVPQKFTIGKNATVLPVSSLPKVQVTSQGNKVIKLQNLTTGNPRSILPRSSVGTVTPISTSLIRPLAPNQVITTTSGNLATTFRPTLAGQPIQLVRLPDGQLQVKGLQNGQQIIQKGDGKIHLLSAKPQQITANSQPLQQLTATTSQSPLQVAQQMKTVSGVRDFTIRNISPLTSGQIVKINGQQMIIRTSGANGKQLVGVTSPEGQKLISTPLSPKFKTIQSSTSSSSPPTTSATLLREKQLLPLTEQQKSPLGSPAKSNTTTSTLTLRVQVKMTEQGPKTIIQGLQPGIGLTKDHIIAIQHQVRSMLSQYNLQVNQLSPLMTLTLHITNRAQSSPQQQQYISQPQSSQTGVLVTKPTNQAPSQLKIRTNDAGLSNKIMVSKGQAYMNTVVGSQKLPMQDLSPKESLKPFVVTNDYIQQTIKSALNKDDLSPDVEEKLVHLQQKFTDKGKAEVEKPVVASPPKRGAKRQRAKEENHIDSSTHPKSRAKKPRTERAPKGKKDSGVIPPPNTKAQQQEIKRKAVKQQKLETLLAKHKDLLKKDVLKKRALLEKELQIQIHKELAVAKKHFQIMEKIKSAESLLTHTTKKKSEGASAAKDTPSRTHTSKKADSVPLQAQHQTPAASPMTKGGPKTTLATSIATSASKTKKSKQSSKNKKIVCICRTPFDDTKFYVGCDLCGNWFHGDCVGITEALSRTLSEYVCDDCANAKLNKDLFCFCRQPYDETQFYICCERCEDWYHGKCIGIMQSEADDIDDYICPKCDPNNQWNRPCQRKLTNKEYSEVKKVAKSLIQHKNAWPFLEPVDQNEVPDYYKVVKTPIDLKSIDQKVSKLKYENLAKFVADVMLVFDNCRAYNPPTSSFCACANTLELFFCQRLKQLKQKLSQKS